LTSRAKASERELELLMGLHGGFFYIAMRRWIYGQGVANDQAPERFSHSLVHDRVLGYLIASQTLFGKAPISAASKTSGSTSKRNP
jgi:hypothetical protein